MFIYCLWTGDIHENRGHLLGHTTKLTAEEFNELCNTIKRNLIQSTSQNHEVMDTVDGVKSIWEYAMDDDMLREMKKILITEYCFFELKGIINYHVKGVDPYDYD